MPVVNVRISIVMKYTMSTVRRLQRDGKLHKRVLFRLWYMFIIALAASVVLVYELFTTDFSWVVALVTLAVSIILGVWFSNIYRIRWDEAEQLIAMRRFDRWSASFLVVYIALRYGVEYFVSQTYPGTILAFGIGICMLAGVAMGRFLGLNFAIKRADNKAGKINGKKSNN